MSDYNIFQPFGEGVRVGCTGFVDGDKDIAANLQDLCKLHQADLNAAKSLDYPNGSIAILSTDAHSMASEVYLTEYAYSVFMAWVRGGMA